MDNPLLYRLELVQAQRIEELENLLALEHGVLVATRVVVGITFVLIILKLLHTHYKNTYRNTGNVVKITLGKLRPSGNLLGARKVLHTLEEEEGELAPAINFGRDEIWMVGEEEYEDEDEEEDEKTVPDSDTTMSSSVQYTPLISDASSEESAIPTPSSPQTQTLLGAVADEKNEARRRGIVEPADAALSHRDTFIMPPNHEHRHFDISSPSSPYTPTRPRLRNFGNLSPETQKFWHRKNVQEKTTRQKEEQKRQDEAIRCMRMGLHQRHGDSAYRYGGGIMEPRVLGHGREKHDFPDFKRGEDEVTNDAMADLARGLRGLGEAEMDEKPSALDKRLLTSFSDTRQYAKHAQSEAAGAFALAESWAKEPLHFETPKQQAKASLANRLKDEKTQTSGHPAAKINKTQPQETSQLHAVRRELVDLKNLVADYLAQRGSSTGTCVSKPTPSPYSDTWPYSTGSPRADLS